MGKVLDLKNLKPGDVVHVKTRDEHWWVGITQQTICHDTAAVSLMIMTTSDNLQHKYAAPSFSSASRTLRRQGELKINSVVRGTITELYLNDKPFE